MDDKVAYYVQQLHSHGEDAEDAYAALVEMDARLLPDLIAAYHTVESISISSLIVEIVGEHQREEDIAFLADVLRSNVGQIWKAALDALVKIGSDQSVAVLNDAQKEGQGRTRLEWYEEAIQQIEARSSEQSE